MTKISFFNVAPKTYFSHASEFGTTLIILEKEYLIAGRSIFLFLE